MQQTKRSLLGLLISLIAHGIVIGFILWNWNEPSDSANSAQGDISKKYFYGAIIGHGVGRTCPEPEDVQKSQSLSQKMYKKSQNQKNKEIVEDPTIKPEPKKNQKNRKREKPKPKKSRRRNLKKGLNHKENQSIKSYQKAMKILIQVPTIMIKRVQQVQLAKSNAQVAGSGTDTSEIAAYRSAIRREIESHKRYPTRAKIMRKQGKSECIF